VNRNFSDVNISSDSCRIIEVAIEPPPTIAKVLFPKDMGISFMVQGQTATLPQRQNGQIV
jgi:hypothetical protein